jgi:hypothetical protein
VIVGGGAVLHHTKTYQHLSGPSASMTHLSPLSYPSRGVITMYMLAFAIFRTWYTDKGKIFALDNIKTLQPRTLAALYLFASMILAIASDCLSSYVALLS